MRSPFSGERQVYPQTTFFPTKGKYPSDLSQYTEETEKEKEAPPK